MSVDYLSSWNYEKINGKRADDPSTIPGIWKERAGVAAQMPATVAVHCGISDLGEEGICEHLPLRRRVGEHEQIDGE